MLSQKCQYALRAVFELARHYGRDPVKIAQIAQVQAIPPRFLEGILGQLKQTGFVDSRRGVEGGYLLVRAPEDLTVGEVLRAVEGPIGPVSCVTDNPDPACPLQGACVFVKMWRQVQKAMTDIYDTTTFQHLLDEDTQLRQYVPCYTI